MPPQQPDPNSPLPKTTAEKGWDWLNTPLAPQIATAAHDISTLMDEPSMADQGDYLVPGWGKLQAMGRGFTAGATEGAGNVLAGFTSPIGIALSLTGLGPESSLVRRFPQAAAFLKLPSVRALQSAVQASGGAGFVGHGVATAADPTKTAYERAQGVAEMAGGTAGVLHGAPAVRSTAMEMAQGRAQAPAPAPETRPLATPENPQAPKYPAWNPHPEADSAAEVWANHDQMMQREYASWLNDPRHNSWYGLPTPEKTQFTDPATLPLRSQPGEPPPPPTGRMTDADVAGAKTRLDAAREAARVARGEPPKARKTQAPKGQLGTEPPSLASETGAVRIRRGTQEFDAENRPRWEDDAHVVGEPDKPADRKTPDIPKPFKTEGGFYWVMPSGDYEFGPTVRDAQAKFRDRGINPTQSAVMDAQRATKEAKTAAAKAAAYPDPHDPNRPWTDAPEGAEGLYSPLRRMVNDLPEQGITDPQGFLKAVDRYATKESAFKGFRGFVENYAKEHPGEPIPKDAIHQYLDEHALKFDVVHFGRPQAVDTVGDLTPHPTAPDTYTLPFSSSTLRQGIGDATGAMPPPETHNAVIKKVEGGWQAAIPSGGDTGTGYSWSLTNSPNDLHQGTQASTVRPTLALAEDWVRQRLRAGLTTTRGTMHTMIPAYDFGQSQGFHSSNPAEGRKETTLLRLPGEVPSNRVPLKGYGSPQGGHYDPWNVFAFTRQQRWRLSMAGSNAVERGRILEEIQSDVLQRARYAREDEIARRQQAKVQELVNGGKTEQEAQAEYPYRQAEKDLAKEDQTARGGTPWEFRADDPATKAILDAQEAEVQRLDRAHEAVRTRRSEIRERLREARGPARDAIFADSGYPTREALENAADIDNYENRTGRNWAYADERVQALTPQERAQYEHANHYMNAMSDPERMPEIAPDYAAVNQEWEDSQEAIEAARQAHEDAQELYRQTYDTYHNKPPQFPYHEGADYAHPALATHLYDVATNPKESFTGLVGGYEQARRWYAARPMEAIRHDPETGLLHFYDAPGHGATGKAFGNLHELTAQVGGDTRGKWAPPLDVGKNPSVEALSKYMDPQAARILRDRITNYSGYDLRPQERYPASGEGDAYVTNNPEDPERYGTRQTRAEARVNWADQQRQQHAQRGQGMWVDRRWTETVDLEHAANAEFAAKLKAWQRSRRADKGPRPVPPPGARTTYGNRHVIRWYGQTAEERKDFSNHFRTMAKAREEITRRQSAPTPDYDPMEHWPGDAAVYGHLQDHYDPEYDPTRAGQLKPGEAEAEDPENPGMVRIPATPEKHPRVNRSDVVTPDTAPPEDRVTALRAGGGGLVSNYDQRFLSKMMELLKRHGWDPDSLEKHWTAGSGAQPLDPNRPGGRDSIYLWIMHLPPEVKASIAKGGFSLMTLALALRDQPDVPDEVKNKMYRSAVLQQRQEGAHGRPQ